MAGGGPPPGPGGHQGFCSGALVWQLVVGNFTAAGVPFLLFAIAMPNYAKRRKAAAKAAGKP